MEEKVYPIEVSMKLCMMTPFPFLTFIYQVNGH